MANTIQVKRSGSSGSIPSSLAAGELALNTADRVLYSSDGATVFRVGAGTSASPIPVSQGGTGLSSIPTVGQILVGNATSTGYALAGQAFINAQNYGATGNGATDDYVAVQTALNAAFNAGGGVVYLPPTGTPYYLTKGLIVPPGVTLQGAGSKTFYANNGGVTQWSKTGTWIQCVDSVNTACQLGNPTYADPTSTGMTTLWNSGVANCTIAGNGTTATLAYPSGTPAYTAAAGNIVTITGASNSAFNGAWRVSSATSSTITFSCYVSGSASSATVYFNEANGASLLGVNFIYDQSTAVSQPTTITSGNVVTYPYAFTVSGNYCHVSDVMIVNASHGFSVTYSGIAYGIQNGTGTVIQNVIIGSPWYIGFQTVNVNDTILLDNIQVNNIMSGNPVHNWMWDNVLGWDCQYTDNSVAKNIIFNFINTGIRFTDGTCFGATHSWFNGFFENVGFNIIGCAMKVAANTTHVIGTGNNFLVGTQNVPLGSQNLYAFDFRSDNVTMQIANLNVSWVDNNVFAIGNGSGGTLMVNGFYCAHYGTGQLVFNLAANSNASVSNYNVIKGSGGNFVAGGGIAYCNTDKYGIWNPIGFFETMLFTGTGSTSVLTTGSQYAPIQYGAKQVRISGTLYVVTGVTSGTTVLNFPTIPELTVSMNTATSAANVNFDSNWIDVTTNSIFNAMYFNSTSGVQFYVNALSVEWR
jgi:hypothetical protein